MKPQASSPPACGGKHQIRNPKTQTPIPNPSSLATNAATVLVGVLLVSLCAVTACRKADNDPPTVLSTYPADGATDVQTNVFIRVTFSEPMIHAAASAAFSVTGATGTFSWSGNTMYWQPDQYLLPQTPYSYSIDTTACDVDGNRLDLARTVSFTTGDDTAAAVYFVMFGRSVMSGWFSHWLSDPYTRGRFTFGYNEVPSPPDIADAVCAEMDSWVYVPEHRPVVFFKLCFVDFVGGDSASAQENLDRNFGYVEQVFDKACSLQLRMIVGNALPQLANATDQWLVWNHRQYNQRLVAFAGQHPDSLAVFDMYVVLSDANGNLKPAYATGPDDSYPNDAGYTALDATFFPFLEQHY